MLTLLCRTRRISGFTNAALGNSSHSTGHAAAMAPTIRLNATLQAASFNFHYISQLRSMHGHFMTKTAALFSLKISAPKLALQCLLPAPSHRTSSRQTLGQAPNTLRAQGFL